MRWKRPGVKRPIWLALLVLGTTPLTGCETGPALAGYCPTAIHPDQETKDWLKRLGAEDTPAECRPPASANQYLHNIGEQQKTIEKNCPQPGAWRPFF